MSTISWLLDPNKYYHSDPRIIERGIVGGNNVSLYAHNLVDLESDLSGRTRSSSRCVGGKFLPGTFVQGTDACNCGRSGGVCRCQSKFVHLPQARMINYKPRVSKTGLPNNKWSLLKFKIRF